MKNRYRLYRRKLGGVFYVHDSETGKQESLGTRDRAEATTLLNARNESVRQPQLNLHIAKAYLAGTDSGVSTRTWQNALDVIIETKSGSTQDRWRRAARDAALDLIRDRVIIETQAEQLLACLKAGTVSTNVHLRKLHNFCLSMNWLPGRSFPNVFGRKFDFSQNVPSPPTSTSSSLNAKRIQSCAISITCVGTWEVHNQTLRIYVRRTLIGMTV